MHSVFRWILLLGHVDEVYYTWNALYNRTRNKIKKANQLNVILDWMNKRDSSISVCAIEWLTEIVSSFQNEIICLIRFQLFETNEHKRIFINVDNLIEMSIIFQYAIKNVTYTHWQFVPCTLSLSPSLSLLYVRPLCHIILFVFI